MSYSPCIAGRPTKLTPEVQQTVLEILRNGGNRAAAVGRARVSMATFHDWLKRGAKGNSGIYCDFMMAVHDAEAQPVLMALRTVRNSIIGGWYKVPKRDRDGNYLFKRDPITGEILRDPQGRPEAELVDEYIKPSSADARWFLERYAPDDFGVGRESVTVNVNTAPPRPNPSKREMVNLFDRVVQILVDNGMKVPELKTLEHQGRKAIETTATPSDEAASTVTSPTKPVRTPSSKA